MEVTSNHTIYVKTAEGKTETENLIPDYAICYDEYGKEVGRIYRNHSYNTHHFRRTNVEGKVVVGKSSVVEILPNADPLCITPEKLRSEGRRVGVIRNGGDHGQPEIYEYVFSNLSLDPDLPTTPNELRCFLESIKVGEEDGVAVFEDILYPGETRFLGKDLEYLLPIPKCMKDRPGEYFVLAILRPL